MRRLIIGVLFGLGALVPLSATPAAAKVPGPNGRIAFAQFEPAMGATVTYTVNPDGSHSAAAVRPRIRVSPLVTGRHPGLDLLLRRRHGRPHRRPRQRQLPRARTARSHARDPLRAMVPGRAATCLRELRHDRPESRNGIYSIRASDGGELTRITSNRGGDDIPGDYSPDGKRLVFVRSDPDGQVGLYVTKLNGSGLRQITPPGMILDDLFGGSWSPSGNKILFASRSAADHRLAIWTVDADGSGLRQLPITPACGGAFSDPRSTLLLPARLVAGRNEDRLHPHQFKRDTGEHLHRERRRQRPHPTHKHRSAPTSRTGDRTR